MRFLIAALLLLAAPVHARDAVDADMLMRDLATLAADEMEGRQTGTEGAVRARTYIERRFTELGLGVTRTPFDYTRRGRPAKRGINLWTRIEGRRGGGETIVISAHYDHVGIREDGIHNGADDNASGVAALFAIAAALRAAPPEHDVILVAFDAEEVGLFGAYAFVETPPVPRERIVLNLNLDMISRGDGGELWAVGTRLFPALLAPVEEVAASAPIPLRPGNDIVPGERTEGREDWTDSSDQAAFGAAGIPYLFFSVENHVDYHEPGDDADKVDPAFYGGAVRTVLAMLRRLDGDAALLERAGAEAAARVKPEGS